MANTISATEGWVFTGTISRKLHGKTWEIGMDKHITAYEVRSSEDEYYNVQSLERAIEIVNNNASDYKRQS